MRKSLWRSALMVGAVVSTTVGIAGVGSLVISGRADASVSSSQDLPPIYSNWPENSPDTNWPCLATPSYGCAEGSYTATTAATITSMWPISGSGYLAAASSNSYGPHNCTLYAAFRLAAEGVPDPGVLGNASQWATSAHAKKILVNQTPSVGAIAQWNAGAGGDGHVAYVESVDPGGTGITISEDNYLPDSGYGDLDGGYTAQIHITTGSSVWPANFIHFTVPAPTVSSFSASPSTLTANGGTVTLSANVTNATSCTFTSNRAVSGLLMSTPCSNGNVSDTVSIPANSKKGALSLKFTLTVSGKNKVTESVTVDEGGAAIKSVPFLLAPFIPEMPVVTQGETFYDSSWSMNYESGEFLQLAGSGTNGSAAPVIVDDGLTLTVTHKDGSTSTFSNDFDGGCSADYYEGPFNVSGLFDPGKNTVTLQLHDVCGGGVGSIPIWLTS
jgi:surface antigen